LTRSSRSDYNRHNTSAIICSRSEKLGTNLDIAAVEKLLAGAEKDSGSFLYAAAIS